MKLVDTTFLIDALKGELSAAEKARELDEEGGVATTAVNVYEIAYGVHSRKSDAAYRVDALERLLSNLDVLPLDQVSALRAAEITGGLDRTGEHVDPFDALIAGIALENGVDCLVTRNTKHFKRIKGLKIETY